MYVVKSFHVSNNGGLMMRDHRTSCRSVAFSVIAGWAEEANKSGGGKQSGDDLGRRPPWSGAINLHHTHTHTYEDATVA